LGTLFTEKNSFGAVRSISINANDLSRDLSELSLLEKPCFRFHKISIRADAILVNTATVPTLAAFNAENGGPMLLIVGDAVSTGVPALRSFIAHHRKDEKINNAVEIKLFEDRRSTKTCQDTRAVLTSIPRSSEPS
jgi:hypothetical protein